MGGVVAIMRVKDEADIIEHTIRRLQTQVDRVLVADNASTDGTRDILRGLDVDVIDDPDVGYYQSEKMSTLASFAGQELGAAWVIPVDADEVWMSPFGRVADILGEHPQASIATAQLYDHVATGQDADIEDPVARTGWRRRDPAPLGKVACRPYPRVTIHQGNHGADYGATLDGLLVVRHFPYRTPEQMIRKARNGAAAYAATDLPEQVGEHWRSYGRLGDEQIADTFRTWFWTAHPEADETLTLDPCPL